MCGALSRALDVILRYFVGKHVQYWLSLYNTALHQPLLIQPLENRQFAHYSVCTLATVLGTVFSCLLKTLTMTWQQLCVLAVETTSWCSKSDVSTEWSIVCFFSRLLVPNTLLSCRDFHSIRNISKALPRIVPRVKKKTVSVSSVEENCWF